METFWLGPIPVVIQFRVGLNGTAVGEMGYVSPSVWKFSSYRWDYTSTGFDFQLCFAPSLSVGVGIGGVCSVSVKGSLAITFSVHAGPLPEGAGVENPHVRLAAMVSLSLEVEMLFFTKSHTICEDGDPEWYDSWKSSAAKVGNGVGEYLTGKSLGQALDGAQIITEKALAPGTTSRYRVEYVTIPEKWEGEREIEIFLSAVYAVGASGLDAQAEGEQVVQAEAESIEYIPDKHVSGTLSLGTRMLSSGVGSDFDSADVVVLTQKPSPFGAERPDENDDGESKDDGEKDKGTKDDGKKDKGTKDDGKKDQDTKDGGNKNQGAKDEKKDKDKSNNLENKESTSASRTSVASVASKANSTSSTSTPKTGDGLFAVGGAAGLLAFGGAAGLMAYSRRRAQLERERRESDEPSDL